MSGLAGTVLLMVLLGFVAGLTSWGIVGALAHIRRGFGAEIYFAGGMTVARVVQGIAGGGAIAATTSGFLSRWDPRPMTYIVIIIVGAVTVLGGLRIGHGAGAGATQTLQPGDLTPSPDATPARFRVLLTSTGLTLISPRQWLLTAAAVSAVAGLSPRAAERVAVFAVYVVAAVWFPLTLLVVRLVRPRQAAEIIARTEHGIRAKGRRVLSYAVVVVGCGLIVLGVGGLWAQAS